MFLAVVDEGGFAAAADALGVSQPAVSQAVKELEGELGALLFDRAGRKVRLRAAGEALVPAARQVLADLQAGRARVEEVAGLRGGHLELACLPTLAVSPVAPLVGRFAREHRAVSVALVDCHDGAELVAAVHSGRAEIGITERAAAPGLVTLPLANQEFLVVLPPGTPVAEPFGLRELAGLPLVAAPKGSSTRALLDEALLAAGAEAEVVVEAGPREALLPLIAAGAGAGLLPGPLAEGARGFGCPVVVPDPPVTRAVALVHRDGPLSPAAQRFVDLARAG